MQQNAPAIDAISYAGYRDPPDVISYAVWLCYRFLLSLRMVEELLGARGIELTYEIVRHCSGSTAVRHTFDHRQAQKLCGGEPGSRSER